MLNTNNDIWGLLCAGSGHIKEEMQILHLPTTVKNAKGDNIIRGYIGTSLHWKQEVEFSTNYLLDMVTTAPLLQVQDEHLLLTPPNITRNRTAITKTEGQEWVPTRCPVVIPLVGNKCSGQIKEDPAPNLDMVKAYHPLAWYWLNAVRGFNANNIEDVNVLADCKDYQDVLRIKEHLLFESPKIYLKLTPHEEQHAACMKQARARRREMRAANQKYFYTMNAQYKCLPDSEDDITIVDEDPIPPMANLTQTDAATHAPNPTNNSATIANDPNQVAQPTDKLPTSIVNMAPPVTGLTTHNLQPVTPSTAHNVNPITQTNIYPPMRQITFQQQTVQTQQPPQQIRTIINQQPPPVPPQHHNPNPPSLSGINPFVLPGLKPLLELPQLATTRTLPVTSVNHQPDQYVNDNGSYCPSGSSINTGHIFKNAENSASIKIMLATVGYNPQGNPDVSHPVLIPIIEGCNNVRAAEVNSHLYRNIPLFATRFAKTRDYLHKMTNMPITAIPTINHFMHCNWHLGNLDDHLDRLTKVLSVLNYLAPPVTPAEKGIYDSLNNRMEHEIAETQLDQIESHRSVRNMQGFIMGRQKLRSDAITLIANLTCKFWFCIQDHDHALNCPLIIKFLLEFADTISTPKFRDWHDKHEKNYPWLTHTYVVMIHEVIRIFAQIAIDDVNQRVLSTGKSLTPAVYQGCLDIMLQMQTSLKSGLLRNSIGDFAQPPASYAYFRNSIEGRPQRTPRYTNQGRSQRGNDPAGTQRTTAQQLNQGNTSNQRPQRISGANETGWIVKIARGRNFTLPWMTGGVRLCADYCIIGNVCNNVDGNCPKGLHSTYAQLSTTNKATVDHWIASSRSLAWPDHQQGN